MKKGVVAESIVWIRKAAWILAVGVLPFLGPYSLASASLLEDSHEDTKADEPLLSVTKQGVFVHLFDVHKDAGEPEKVLVWQKEPVAGTDTVTGEEAGEPSEEASETE